MPAIQETWVLFMGWEDPPEKEMWTQSSILAWKIPWTEEPGGLQSMGSQRVQHDWATEPPAQLDYFATVWILFWNSLPSLLDILVIFKSLSTLYIILPVWSALLVYNFKTTFNEEEFVFCHSSKPFLTQFVISYCDTSIIHVLCHH